MAKKPKTPKQFTAVIKKLRKEISKLEKARKADESHEGSPAQNRGETYEEFKKRTGETSMKAYMRDNPTGSKNK